VSSAQLVAGQRLVQAGNHAGAVHHLEDALRVEPSNASAHSWLALALSGSGEKGALQRALSEAEEGVRLAPNVAWSHHVLAEVLYTAHRYAEAVDSARRALTLSPRKASVYSTLSAALREVGRFQLAVEAAQEGLQIDPASAACLHQRALGLLCLGRTEEAIDGVVSGLARAPLDPFMQNNLGVAFAVAGRFDLARDRFSEAARLDPALNVPRENLKRFGRAKSGPPARELLRRVIATGHLRARLWIRFANPWLVAAIVIALSAISIVWPTAAGFAVSALVIYLIEKYRTSVFDGHGPSPRWEPRAGLVVSFLAALPLEWRNEGAPILFAFEYYFLRLYLLIGLGLEGWRQWVVIGSLAITSAVVFCALLVAPGDPGYLVAVAAPNALIFGGAYLLPVLVRRRIPSIWEP
jgi:Flp pilus assembly protein TadD